MLGHQKKEKFDILFIIPLGEEFETFSDIIEIRDQRIHGTETFYFVEIPNSNYSGIVAICFESGISRAINITKTALSFFDVKMVINIGIAGGLNDELKLGDVVIAKSVIEYQADSRAQPKIGDEGSYEILRSPNTIPISHSLIQNINHFRFSEKPFFIRFQEISNNFLNHLKLNGKAKKFVNKRPNYYVEKIASGNTVIATKILSEELKKSIERKIFIVEMEAAGIARATWEILKPIPTLIIRGISDFADEKKSELDNIFHGVYKKYAMHNAVHFFLVLIQTNSFQKLFKEIYFFRIPDELKLNEIQRKLRDALSQNPYRLKNLDNIYIGAKLVILDESNPERYFQCAYSLKYLILSLINEVEINTEIENPILQKIKLFTKQIFDNNGSPNEKFIEQWYKLFNYFDKIVSRSLEPISQIFNDNISKLEFVISSLIVQIYDVLPELEKLMDIQNPTDDDMEKVKSIIGPPPIYRYFFSNLTNPNWLPLLEKNGYYDKPPEKDKYSIETLYLIKIADQKSSDVARIIKKLANTRHKFVQVNFLRAILKLPSEETRNLKEEIKIWMNIPFSENHALFNEVKKLINKLVEKNELNLATELYESIIDLERYISVKNNL